MKTLLQINTVCNTSTGKLMLDIQKEANLLDYETVSIVGRRKVNKEVKCIKIGNAISFWIHVGITTIFDLHGFGSYFVTKKMVNYIKEKNPDIIHLHNIHGYYLNYPILFEYLSKEYKGKVVWTFHDCWPMTGHCAFFTDANCEKWKKECNNCPNQKKYPISYFLDLSKYNYRKKKKLFCAVMNMTIIVPSMWMKEIVEASYFKDNTIEVVPNGIDQSIFYYREDFEKTLKKYSIPKEKKLILGVANIWDERKGLGDFLELSKELEEGYHIVLVGLKKNQIKKLPQNMTGITYVEKKEELAKLYSATHIFLNPSTEESFSLVTVEALSCGTPIIVLDTSAVKEFVEASNGIVLSEHKTIDYLNAIKDIEKSGLSRAEIIKSAKKYSDDEYRKRVMSLYEEL